MTVAEKRGANTKKPKKADSDAELLDWIARAVKRLCQTKANGGNWVVSVP